MEGVFNTPEEAGKSKNWNFAAPENVKDGKKPFVNSRLDRLPEVSDRMAMDGGERAEALSSAFKKLVHDESLYRRNIKAIERSENQSVAELAAIENLFIRYCINLSPDEIKNLVESFITKRKKWFNVHKAEFTLSPLTENNVVTGKHFLSPEGIISVVEYIKSRKQFFNLEPSQRVEFCVNSTLDAKWKIDVIELVCGASTEKPKVDTMNLVQVKTRPPEEYEVAQIQKDHADWVKESLIDFAALEKWYVDDPKNVEGVKKVFDDLASVEEIFTDICTSPDPLSGSEMLDRLGLRSLVDKSRAWLVWRYIPILLQHLVQAKEDGAVDDNGYYDIKQTLESAHEELVSRAKLPRNLIEIRRINSVVASRGKIIEKGIGANGKLLSFTPTTSS